MIDISKYAKGFKFYPFDEELIEDYLKPQVMGKQLPCDLIKHKQVYGPSSNPWRVFDSGGWFRAPGLKKTEKCVFVFAKLSKLSKLNVIGAKNTKKRAGCGTWAGKGKQDQIEDDDGNLIGEKRYLVFEITDPDSVEPGFDLSKVGQYKMHEYSLCGVNAGLNSAGTTVLCKITHDPSKECHINRKSGSKIDGNVSTSSSEAVHEEEESSYKNVEGTSSVTAENLTMLHSGVGPVRECFNAIQFSNDVQEFGDGECSAAQLISNDLPVGDFSFDDPVGDFSFDDLINCDIDSLLDCLDSAHNEEPSQDNSSSKLKRKFESEEGLYQSKKMCLVNPI